MTRFDDILLARCPFRQDALRQAFLRGAQEYDRPVTDDMRGVQDSTTSAGIKRAFNAGWRARLELGYERGEPMAGKRPQDQRQAPMTPPRFLIIEWLQPSLEAAAVVATAQRLEIASDLARQHAPAIIVDVEQREVVAPLPPDPRHAVKYPSVTQRRALDARGTN